MDFRFSEGELAFREEVRSFLEQELPPDWEEEWDQAVADEFWEFEKYMRRKLAEKGWLAMNWPKGYGGQSASHVQQVIFAEEMTYRGAPGRDIAGVDTLGPGLIKYGTEAQKKQHLGGAARGEVLWCGAFSEPGAGSDLASLQTRAVLDGDDYVINGQKTWTSAAHRADWMWVFVRTDPDAPKHKGITCFLLDMKTPGITLRPIVTMTERNTFCEVFFDNVRVPRENMLGELNQGWYVAMTTLNHDRARVDYCSWARRVLKHVMDYAKETKYNGQLLSQNPVVRHKLSEIAIEVEIALLMVYNIAWMRDNGLPVDYYSIPITKLFCTEVLQRATNVGMQVVGLSSQLKGGSKWAALEGRLQNMYLYAVSPTIYDGSSELQRNVIAIKGLGLPR
ncbi:MAG: acyl-CoA dehydrogenase family protein [Dehalococcoidia bacterium]